MQWHERLVAVCSGEIRTLEGLPGEFVVVCNESSESAKKFCYLGEMIRAGGGVEESIGARIRCGWKKFRELFISPRCFHCAQKYKLLKARVRSVVTYGSETRAVKEEELPKLERNGMMMVLWMCNVILKDRNLLTN